ncbi:hypothetical protein EST38_g10530 [Candolleomyces aberdarensis]|uniref:Charged multivesicular body protein 6 n=1 Tax=Candolleomyces aberdarensis TaxID=2316362 RepID=A0A4Q2D754_9AGAR|nr:hypothetical protein EST38_g10530 [Candolleomyces aberdarensis]
MKSCDWYWGSQMLLKLQRDKVRQYQKKIQGVLDREEAIARAHLEAGRKDRALIALRQRKYQQSLLQKTDGQLENLEQLVSTIEFSLVEVSVLHGLKQGNEVLKDIHRELNIESVEKLLEETAEAREYQQEISEMLSNNLTMDEEEAVQEELRQLQAEVQEAEVQKPVVLPSVPDTQPETRVEEGEEPVPEGQRSKVAVPA